MWGISYIFSFLFFLFPPFFLPSFPINFFHHLLSNRLKINKRYEVLLANFVVDLLKLLVISLNSHLGLLTISSWHVFSPPLPISFGLSGGLPNKVRQSTGRSQLQGNGGKSGQEPFFFFSGKGIFQLIDTNSSAEKNIAQGEKGEWHATRQSCPTHDVRIYLYVVPKAMTKCIFRIKQGCNTKYNFL